MRASERERGKQSAYRRASVDECLEDYTRSRACVPCVRPTRPANDKALAGELSTAKNALAEFEAKLATSEKYSADLANQVQTLLGEMASLQRETEVRLPGTRVHGC